MCVCVFHCHVYNQRSVRRIEREQQRKKGVDRRRTASISLSLSLSLERTYFKRMFLAEEQMAFTSFALMSCCLGSKRSKKFS